MLSSAELGFDHRYIPGTGVAARTTLLLLHGTGGDADSLLQLGHALYPDATLLSPAGPVFEHGARRFFRRFAEGVFDLDDLLRRTDDLYQFVNAAVTHYGLDPARIVAAGYSNGANIAASLVLRHPGVLAGAVLFRAMVPYIPEPLPAIPATPVLLCAGRADPLVPPALLEQLATLLESSGAVVARNTTPDGHELSIGDVTAARRWLAATFPAERE